MKLAHQIVAMTFLISTVAIVGITGLTLEVATDALHDQLRKGLGDGVDREARMLQTSVDMVKNDLALLAEGGTSSLLDEHSGPNADSLQMLADQLNAMMRTRPDYAQVHLILSGATGPRLLRGARRNDAVETTLDPPSASPTPQAFLQEKQGLRPRDSLAAIVQETPAGAGDGEAARDVLYFSAPVSARGGATLGAVAIIVDLQRLLGGHGRPREEVAFYVGDRTGRYLHRSEPVGARSVAKRNMRDDFGLRERWSTWLGQADRHLQHDFDGGARIADLRRVVLVEATAAAPADVLVIGGTASLADVEMKASKFRVQLALTVLGAGSLMVLALAFAIAYVVRPIERLTKVADRMAAGDRDVVAPTRQHNEIGVLARAMVRMADELRKTAKNSEQAAMGRMASMIAHDLRNALSSVKMNLHILQTHHREENDDHIDGCETALEQVRYMEHILNDLLAFARPGTLDLDWMDLEKIIQTACVSVLPEATRKSIDLRSSNGQKLPTIRGDRTKLLQLLQNLLDNAIQAAPDGGHVVIETRALLHDSRPAVEIKVIDDGPGVPPEVADKLFEPFVTTRARGTGLGLAIVQRIVKQHGGQITLVSGAAGGAVATVVLPLSSDDPEPASGDA